MSTWQAIFWRRKWIIVIFFLSLSSLFSFSEKAFFSLTRHFFCFVIQNKLNCEFDYEDIFLSDNGICFKNVEMKGANSKIWLKSENVLLKMHGDLSKFSLFFSLQIIEPSLQINSKLASFVRTPKTKKKQFFKNLKIEVVHGEIFIDSGEKIDEMLFSGTLSDKATSLQLHKADSLLDLQITEREVLFSFSSFAIDSLTALFFSSEYALKGKITGKASFNLQNNSFKESSLNINFEDGTLSKGKEWKISSLKGFLSHEKEIGIRTELTAVLQIKEWEKPFQWQGKGFFASAFQNWLEGFCSFGEEETFSIKAEGIGSKTIDVQLACSEMPSELGDFFLSLFKEKVPGIKNVNWNKGKASF